MCRRDHTLIRGEVARLSSSRNRSAIGCFLWIEVSSQYGENHPEVFGGLQGEVKEFGAVASTCVCAVVVRVWKVVGHRGKTSRCKSPLCSGAPFLLGPVYFQECDKRYREVPLMRCIRVSGTCRRPKPCLPRDGWRGDGRRQPRFPVRTRRHSLRCAPRRRSGRDHSAQPLCQTW